MRAVVALLILVFAPAFARAAETPIPPSPERWVTDNASFMSQEAARSLDARLQAYQGSTGHQLLVYIGKTTGGVPIEDWAVRAFEAWKVGRKGIDDGLALFVMSDDRKVRIEVGYGLEPKVTDAAASRIIREVIAPRIQAGDRDGAIVSGMEAVARLIDDQGLSGAPAGRSSRPPHEAPRVSVFQLIFFGIVAILFLILLVTHPSLAIFLLMNILSSGRRNGRNGGGWGGGGGGFIGGGGRSGGGGASGGW